MATKKQHPTPATDAVIEAARDAINALKPAFQADIDAAIEAVRPEFEAAARAALDSGDPVAAKRVIDAEQAVRAATSPAEVAAAAATVVYSDNPTPEPEPSVVTPVPVAAPAAPVTTEVRDTDAPAWFSSFRTAVERHDDVLYGKDGNPGLVKDVIDHDRRISALEGARWRTAFKANVRKGFGNQPRNH